MKFIHTADWQLGMAFRGALNKASYLRQARIDVVKKIVALAEREKVDFVIAAGDLLDDNRPGAETIEAMAEAIKHCPVPVYLLPGNHDPLTQDSPYLRCRSVFPDKAVVLDKEEPLSIPGATLYPCPARSRSSSKDPTLWIPAERSKDDGIRIGVAHGSVGKIDLNHYPIAMDSAKSKNLDYLALGHWHGSKEIDERTWYSGAPEATEFGQEEAGNVLIVEIAAPETVPKVRTVPVAQYRWQDLEREVHSESEVTELLADLEKKADNHLLLRLRVKGTLKQPQLDRLERFNGERIFLLKKELDVILENGTWEYKHPLLKGMANLIAEKAHGVRGADETAAKEAENARLALSKLRRFAKQAGFKNEEV